MRWQKSEVSSQIAEAKEATSRELRATRSGLADRSQLAARSPSALTFDFGQSSPYKGSSRMTDYSIFPKINATLNGCSAVLLVTGRVLIGRGKMAAHRAVMLTAFGTSTLFLASYLYYHWPHHGGIVYFRGTGWARLLYLAILGSHTILAVVIVPMVLITLNRALRGRFDRHRAIARWTFPLWLYVSVTGVVVYLMLYHLFA
jgi:putative membrane protein